MKKNVMKMMMAIVPHGHADDIMQDLINNGFSVTYMESKGGMLRQSQLSLFIAVKNEDVNTVIRIIREHCRVKVDIDTDSSKTQEDEKQSSIKARRGSSVIFIWNLESINAMSQ